MHPACSEVSDDRTMASILVRMQGHASRIGTRELDKIHRRVLESELYLPDQANESLSSISRSADWLSQGI